MGTTTMMMTHTAAAEAAGESPDTFTTGDVYENDGMQWLVIGFAPGFEFIEARATRAEANQAIREYRGKTFDYYAVVKARDFYRLP